MFSGEIDCRLDGSFPGGRNDATGPGVRHHRGKPGRPAGEPPPQQRRQDHPQRPRHSGRLHRLDRQGRQQAINDGVEAVDQVR
jgi:hypothetical protein